MFYGLLASGSVLLSEISRALEEDITLKKTIERLSRNLVKFDKIKKVYSKYIKEVSKLIDDETVFYIDHTDITKPKSTVLEDLGRLRDGSTGKIENGYKILEIAALTKEKKLPVSPISRVFSPEEDNYISENRETLNAFKSLTENFGNKGIRTLDRDFDNKRLIDYFIRKDEKFIIRAKTILKVYLLRWRIEDYFKFKKQQFDFENISVRKMKSIRNMNQILTLVIGFIGILS